jgi:hypothetical protein
MKSAKLQRWAAAAWRGVLGILLVVNALFLAIVAAALPVHRPVWYDGPELLLECGLETFGQAALEDFASDRDEDWTLACLIDSQDRPELDAKAFPLRFLPPVEEDFLGLFVQSPSSDKGLRMAAARRAPGEPVCKPVGPGASLRVADRAGGIRLLVLETGR